MPNDDKYTGVDKLPNSKNLNHDDIMMREDSSKIFRYDFTNHASFTGVFMIIVANVFAKSLKS